MKNAAVVLYMGITGLGITRSLAKQGIFVHGVDWNPDVIGFSSKHCREKHLFASPVENPDQFISQLVDLGKRLGHKAVLFLAADHYVNIVSKHREMLSEYFLFNIPSPSVVDLITDKGKQYKLATELGIPLPVTIPLLSEQDVERCRDLHYPVVVKGIISHAYQTAFGDKANFVNGVDEIRKIYEVAMQKGVGILVQEMIGGPNCNHFKACAFYSRERKLLAHFSTQKTRQYPVDFGVGSLMTSVHMPELMEAAEKFMDGIGYTGVGSIEFKKDERDGVFKFVELNPRFWQQSYQATCAGINFAHLYYLDCMGEDVTPMLNFKENIRWVDTEQDFRSFLINRKRGKLSVWEWIRSVISAHGHANFAPDDWGPFWKRWRFLTRDPFGRLFRKIVKNKK